MSNAKRFGSNAKPERQREHALVFAALGDATRLALVGRLSGGESQSISELAAYCGERKDGVKLTRQAVTKHLHVLEGAGIVCCTRRGREKLYVFDPVPMEEMREFLDFMSRRWDDALGRLKEFVEG